MCARKKQKRIIYEMSQSEKDEIAAAAASVVVLFMFTSASAAATFCLVALGSCVIKTAQDTDAFMNKLEECVA